MANVYPSETLRETAAMNRLRIATVIADLCRSVALLTVDIEHEEERVGVHDISAAAAAKLTAAACVIPAGPLCSVCITQWVPSDLRRVRSRFGLGTAFALRRSMGEPRPKSDQRRGYQWKTRICLRHAGATHPATSSKSRH